MKICVISQNVNAQALVVCVLVSHQLWNYMGKWLRKKLYCSYGSLNYDVIYGLWSTSSTSSQYLAFTSRHRGLWEPCTRCS